MARMRSIKSAIICLSFLHSALVASAVCNSDVYGTPSKWDCYVALDQIPYAFPPRPNPLSQQPRIFAEPQYMNPPFSQVDNIYRPSAIVQLPKIYTFSTSSNPLVSQQDRVFGLYPQLARTVKQPVAKDKLSIIDSCRIAIMSLGRPAQQGVVASQFTTTWKDIVDQSQQFKSCFPRGASSQAKGGYVSLNCKPSPLLPAPRLRIRKIPATNKYHIRLIYASDPSTGRTPRSSHVHVHKRLRLEHRGHEHVHE